MVKKSEWNGPQGSNDLGKDKLVRDKSGLGYPEPKDISNRVDPSWKRSDGFAAKLDKGRKDPA
jgi:hypothetical protein